MKKTIKITTLILSIAIITAWVFNLIDNEKALWAFTVLLPTAIAFWKENKITELKKDIEVLNKQNEMFVKENLRLNKTK
jgi:hypothetical protein